MTLKLTLGFALMLTPVSVILFMVGSTAGWNVLIFIIGTTLLSLAVMALGAYLVRNSRP